jgi:hypothetical protein
MAPSKKKKKKKKKKKSVTTNLAQSSQPHTTVYATVTNTLKM